MPPHILIVSQRSDPSEKIVAKKVREDAAELKIDVVGHFPKNDLARRSLKSAGPHQGRRISSQVLYHRDIKPENFVVDPDFSLKFIGCDVAI